MQKGAVFKTCEGVFKIYDEAVSPDGGTGACLRYMMNRNRHMRNVLKIHYDEREAP